MQITKHFTIEEMERSNTATRLGLPNKCPKELLRNMTLVASHMEDVREHFGKPVQVLSCYRSPAVNAAVGGSDSSAHKQAMAIDFVIPGISNLEVCKWAEENINEADQIIYEFGEQGWVHIGFSNGVPRNQLLTAVKDNFRTKYLQGFVTA